MVLGVLGSSLLTCFSLQGLPWCCNGASPMGGLKSCRRTSVHVVFQLSCEHLLCMGNEEHLGEGAERQTLLSPAIRQLPVFSMWRGNSGEKGDTVSVVCYLLFLAGKSWGMGDINGTDSPQK